MTSSLEKNTVDTVRPPVGANDAYSAATRLQPLPEHVLAAMRVGDEEAMIDTEIGARAPESIAPASGRYASISPRAPSLLRALPPPRLPPSRTTSSAAITRAVVPLGLTAPPATAIAPPASFDLRAMSESEPHGAEMLVSVQPVPAWAPTMPVPLHDDAQAKVKRPGPLASVLVVVGFGAVGGCLAIALALIA